MESQYKNTNHEKVAEEKFKTVTFFKLHFITG